jgi:hypothetical protein
MTTAIWFDREVFEYIASALERDTGTIDGIRVYLGAYDKHPNDKPETDHKNQISVFLVPTSKNGNEHKDEPDFFQELKRLVLNHGELCPPKTGCRS